MKPRYRKWLKRHGVPLRMVPSSVSSPFVDVARRTLQPIKPFQPSAACKEVMGESLRSLRPQFIEFLHIPYPADDE